MSDLTFANRDITNFRQRLNKGGVRSNLFEVEIKDIPGGGEDVQDEVRFLVKAAEIPASNIGNIPVPFRGRVLPVAGDRTFDPWTVAIINKITPPFHCISDVEISIIDNSNCPRIKSTVSSDWKNTTSKWNWNISQVCCWYPSSFT